MKKPLFFILSLFIFHIPTFCLAQTNYYVATNGNDSNNGSISNPWNTIQYALQQVTSGDMIHVRAGTYNEKLFWNNSGTLGVEITLTNYNNESVTLSGTGLSSPQDMIAISSKSHIIINGLTIENNYVQGAKGIYIVGEGSNITIQNCTIQNIGFTDNPNTDPTSVNPTGQAHGILVNGRTTNGYTDITITNNNLNNLITGNSEALTFAGNNDGFLIDNNILHDNTNIGIDIAGHFSWAVDGGVAATLNQSRNGQVSNNLVYNHQRFNNVDAPAGIYVDGGKGVIIEHNICYQNGNGISAGCENAGKSAEDIIIRNNFIYNNVNTGIVFGANSGNLDHSEIRNNTLLKNGCNENFNMEIFLQKSTNCLIANNIINACPSVSNYSIGLFSYDAPNLMIDHNLMFRAGGNLSNLIVDNDTTTPLNDINSIFQDPVLVNTTLPTPDLHIQSTSPAKNAGENTYMSSAETDIDGETRLLDGIIDMGADEFSTPLPIEDVIHFEVTAQDYHILLQWNKPNPIESIHKLVIEKSGDGLAWTELLHFNSMNWKNQSIDFHPLTGENYYRLFFITKNGIAIYSPIQSVNWLGKKQMVFPNPSNGQVFIPLANEQNLSFRLYDFVGRLINQGMVKETMHFSPGFFILELLDMDGQVLKKEQLMIY